MTGRLPATGTELLLDVGDVAHGGHCVARHEGLVVFVRHALPGERVRARVTGSGSGGRFVRADAVEVVAASPARVAPPCPYSGPGRCGGCDWQHASVPEQRRLKTQVLRDALRHQGGLAEVGGRSLEEAVEVLAAPGPPDGLRWRTRMDFAVGGGEAGLFAHRSARVIPVDDCLIATEAVMSTGVVGPVWPSWGQVRAVAASGGERVLQPDPAIDGRAARELARSLPRDVSLAGVAGARSWVREEAAGRTWRVAVDGFWQVHPAAPDLLVSVVRRLLAPRRGEHLLDLYSGVGLFAGALAEDLGPEGAVDAVEANRRAVSDARRNLHDLPQVRLHEAQVAPWLTSPVAPDDVDLVVLDPTRQGAGATVVRAVLALRPRAVAYVACDPVALARDLRTATEEGWRVAVVEAYDLFPMTHHLETVALLVPHRHGVTIRTASG